MPALDGIRGVVFDFGNTLIPFGQRQSEHFRTRIAEFLAGEAAGARAGAARAALDAAFAKLYRARVATLAESDPADAIRLALRALGVEPDEADRVPRGLEAYRRAFLETIEPGPAMEETLEGVRRLGHRTGLLSNFSLAVGIHDALDLLGIREKFDVVVVSGDVGLVKPHPRIFAIAAERIGLAPAEILYVGDKRFADIHGASGAGMRTAWITEHLAGRYRLDPAEEAAVEVEPDLVLPRLADLLTHLGA